MKISRLEWDDINLEHIMARHGLSPVEVEDVCFGPHYAYSVRFKRKAVYGQTESGKYLLVVLQRIDSNAYRVVTARGMTRNERVKYKSIME